MTASDRLIEAIKARDLAAVQRALEESGGVPAAGSGGAEPPLLTAIYIQSKEIINFLLARGAEPDLFEAASLGDVARIRSILAEAPGRLGAHSFDGWPALHLAAHHGHRLAARGYGFPHGLQEPAAQAVHIASVSGHNHRHPQHQTYQHGHNPLGDKPVGMDHVRARGPRQAQSRHQLE